MAETSLQNESNERYIGTFGGHKNKKKNTNCIKSKQSWKACYKIEWWTGWNRKALRACKVKGYFRQQNSPIIYIKKWMLIWKKQLIQGKKKNECYT